MNHSQHEVIVTVDEIVAILGDAEQRRGTVIGSVTAVCPLANRYNVFAGGDRSRRRPDGFAGYIFAASGVIGPDWSRAVNNQREREGAARDFVASQHAWADAKDEADPRSVKYVDGVPHSIAIHITGYANGDGMLVGDDGQRLDPALLDDWKKPKRSKASAQAHQGVERAREYRNVAFSNIQTVAIGGTVYRLAHA